MSTSSDGGGELTARALLVGVLVGALLVLVNVYMGLKTGFNESGNITASLLGFALLRAWSRPNALETNIVQTIATSAAAMCFATGVGGVVPALELGRAGISPWWFAPWGLGLAAVGIALAAWFRERMLSAPRLPFPTGIATAVVIETVHRGGAAATKRVRSLAAAATLGGLVTWFRDGRPAIVPQALMLPGRLFGVELSALALGVALSPMLLAAGVLVGLQLGASVLVGVVGGWAALGPWLVHRGVVAGADYQTMIAWLLWPAAALMVGGALTSLALGWRRFATLRFERASSSGADATAPRLLAGCAVAGALVAMLVGWAGLHVAPWWTALALVIAVVLANVSTRAAGETDVNPVGPMGQLTQIAIGSTTRDAVVNLSAAGITTGVGMQTTTSIWSYKAGRILGATPRRQLWAQLVGAAAGVVVAIPAYIVVARAFTVGSSSLPAPGALAFKAVADAASHGAAAVPRYALAASAIAFALAVVLTLLQRLRRLGWLPAPMAIGIGMLVPACYGVAIFAGALLAAIAQRRWRAWAEPRLESIAAGAIGGEAVIGVLVATLRVCGVLR